MKEQKLVVVGNGMAGIRAVEELLKLAPELYEITVFGAEPYPNYNRILLSPVLAGEMTIQDITLNPLEWYRDHGIRLHLGKHVEQIDRRRRKVFTADGIEVDYDRLLLATGSTPFMPPIPGIDLPGVISYRDIRDTDEMIDTARRHRHAVVIGGGLLGLEAANGLRQRGMEVTVVHLMPWLMERQLDQAAGEMLKISLEARGLKFLLEKQTEALLRGESGRVVGAALQGRPRDSGRPGGRRCRHSSRTRQLAESARLYCNRGVVVNDTHADLRSRASMRSANASPTAAPSTAWSRRSSSRPGCAPTTLPTSASRATPARVTSTKLKVTGIDLFSAGDFRRRRRHRRDRPA
jgi:nitrite reductase (NADH) large subunit